MVAERGGGGGGGGVTFSCFFSGREVSVGSSGTSDDFSAEGSRQPCAATSFQKGRRGGHGSQGRKSWPGGCSWPGQLLSLTFLDKAAKVELADWELKGRKRTQIARSPPSWSAICPAGRHWLQLSV